MDPASAIIGLTASLVQLIGATIKALEYLSDVKDGKDERKELAANLKVLTDVLKRLEARAQEKSPLDSFVWIAQKDGPLEQTKSALENITKQLSAGEGARKVLNAATWPYRQRQVARFLRQVEALKSTILIALAEDNAVISDEIRKNVEIIKDTTAWLQTDTNHVIAILKLTETIRADTDYLRKAIVDLKHQTVTDRSVAIAEWITKTNPFATYNTVVSNWQPGTGGWFLDSTTFQTYRDTPHSTMLCTGRPGAGKSMTAAVTIQYLWQYSAPNEPNLQRPGVCCLFFNYKEQNIQTFPNVLSMLIKQLLLEAPSLPATIGSLHDLLAPRGVRPLLEDLRSCLKEAISSFGKTFVILDALDECDIEVRHKLLEELFELQTEFDVRILVTGRHIPEVTEEFEGRDPLCAIIRANDDDVRSTIESRMHSLGRAVQKDPDLQKTITAKIIKAADGMFLLAILHFEAMKGKATKRDIKMALEKLPTGRDAVNKAYEQNLGRIDDQAEDRRRLAQMSIIFLVHSRPLPTALQLRQLLSVRIDDIDFDEDGLPETELIIDVCYGLLVVEKSTGDADLIRFVHYTADEFFRGQLPFKPERLSSDIFVAKNWTMYFRPPYEINEVVRKRLLQLLSTPSVTNRLHHNTNGPGFVHLSGYTGAHVIAHDGLQEFFADYVKMGNPVMTADIDRRTPLHYAILAGNDDCVADLLRLEGITIDHWATDKYGKHALDYAHESEHAKRLFPLIRTDPRARKAILEMPKPRLRDAVMTNDMSIVKNVLEREGMDPNESNIQGKTALHQAVCQANVDGTTILQLLLEDGRARLDLRDKEGDTCLHMAASRCDSDSTILDLLLNAKSDFNINEKNIAGQTPLHIAASAASPWAIKSLLAHKDINVHSGFRPPILTAIRVGVIGNVEALLSHADSNVNVVHKTVGTPLHHAIWWWGSPKVAAFLLSQPAIDVHILDKWGCTPLMRAAQKGYTQTVKLILAKPDIDVHAKSKDGHDALWYAEQSGSDDVQRLIRAAMETEAGSQ